MSLRTASAKLEKGKKQSDEEPTHHTTLKGYCKKRSTKGKWQKRFFQAHKTTLTYKSTEKSSKILGSIDLKTVGAIISDGSATGFSLQLADRVYKLQVVKGSPPAEEWIKGLNARQLSFAVFSGEETTNEVQKEQQESSSSTTGSPDVVVEIQRLATSQSSSSSSSSSSSTKAPGGKVAAQNSSAAAAVVATKDNGAGAAVAAVAAGGAATPTTTMNTEDEGVALGGLMQNDDPATAHVEKPGRCCVVS